ncbi:MAG: hypothetical protein WC725_03965 [Patescibacteria group bacterium]|jgi:hypothetical protein
MFSNQKKLFTGLGIIILLISIFLAFEIKKTLSISTKTIAEPIVAETATPLKVSQENRVLGAGELWIVTYLDFNDSKSRKLYQTLADFVNSNPTKAQLFLKHTPVAGLFGDNALPNKAAWCAHQQKKLPQFMNALLAGNNIKESGLRAAAASAELNINMWWTCANGEKAKTAVNKDTEEAIQLKLGKPPLIFINNKKISTIQDFDLNELLNSLIAE